MSCAKRPTTKLCACLRGGQFCSTSNALTHPGAAAAPRLLRAHLVVQLCCSHRHRQCSTRLCPRSLKACCGTKTGLIELIALNRRRCIQPRIRGLLALRSCRMWRQISRAAARALRGGDLHKPAECHMAKRVRSKQHAVTVQTSGTLLDSLWTRLGRTSCTAEPSAAATAPRSTSVESTTSFASASAGTCGGTRAFRLRGQSEKRASNGPQGITSQWARSESGP
jgi:hypothetical protein